MKNNLTKYGFLLGLIGVVIEVLLIILKAIEENMIAQEFVYVEQKVSLFSILSDNWAAVLGTLLALVLFFVRVLKGPEAILELLSVMLWGVHLLSKYDSEVMIGEYALSHIVGLVGIGCIFAVSVIDLIDYKKTNNS